MQVPSLSAHTRAEVCESARSLSHSLFITLPPVHPSITHTQLQKDFDEKHTVKVSTSQWEGCQQRVINLVGSVFYDKLKISLCLTREKPLCDIH